MNWECPDCSCSAASSPPLWRRPVLPSRPKARRWRSFWSSACSIFRCISPSQARLRRCAWAVFAAAGFLYATASLLAEFAYERGYHARTASTGLFWLHGAALVFPLDPQMRLAPARYMAEVNDAAYRNLAIEEMRSALKIDPARAELHRNLALLLIAEGDQAGALAEVEAVWKAYRR